MEKTEEENSICVLESYFDEFVCACGSDRRGKTYFYTALTSMRFKTKAEAILHYDLSGRKEPLYDNTGNKMKWAYSADEIRKSMKRLR